MEMNGRNKRLHLVQEDIAWGELYFLDCSLFAFLGATIQKIILAKLKYTILRNKGTKLLSNSLKIRYPKAS